MNNEDKILEILNEMRTDITELKQGQNKIDARMASIESDVSDLKTDVSSLHIIIESDVNRRINLLYDNYVSVDSKLQALADLPEKVDDIQSSVSILKYAFKEHVNEV